MSYILSNPPSTGDEVVLAGDEGPYSSPTLPMNSVINVGPETTWRGAPGQPTPVIYSQPAPAAISNEGHLEGVDVEYSGGSTAVESRHAEGLSRLIVRAPGGFAACYIEDERIANSLCTGFTGIFVGGNTSGDAPATLRNDTAYGASSGLTVIATGATTVPVTVVNSILHGSGSLDVDAEQNSGGVATVNLDHSNYHEAEGVGGATVTAPGSGTDQTAAPLFVDAANGDFREASGSPTIDAGVEEAANGANDLAGSPRNVSGAPACTEPQAGPPDIGAYELVPLPLPSC